MEKKPVRGKVAKTIGWSTTIFMTVFIVAIVGIYHIDTIRIWQDPDYAKCLDNGLTSDECGQFLDNGKQTLPSSRSWIRAERGHIAFEKNDYDKAIAEYSSALKYTPAKQEYYYARSLAYKAKGDDASAQADLKASGKAEGGANQK